jgi:hypothetical protein
MKLLCSFSFVAANLVAQAPQEGVKIPRPPSTGVEKTAPAPKPKAGELVSHEAAPTAPAAAPMASDASASSAVKGGAVEAAGAGIARQLADPEFVAFDEPGDGSLWVSGNSYKTAFDANGWRFIGRPAPAAPSLQPIGFRLASASIGGEPVTLAAPVRTRTDRRIAYDHGSLVETIDVAGRGVEQVFTFHRLPRRGEIVVRMAVETALAGATTADGIVFTGPFDQVLYTPAIAIDAKGERIAAPTSYADGAVTIRVPAHFVEHAALPLRIDPLVSTVQVFNYANDVAEPDAAWDEDTLMWTVAFSRYFGGTDWDVFVQRVNPSNVLVGTASVVDNSGTPWQRPRIANLDAHDRCMVVSQVKSGTNPWTIQGRIFDNAAVAATAQFVVATSTKDEINPDIGGDPAGAPTYFTVVWEHVHSATDHDIHARQVQSDGTLRGATPIYLQTDTDNQTRPSISKGNGGGSAQTQRHVIAWQETWTSSDEDIHGAMLTWDGNIVQVGGNNTFIIENSTGNEINPACSSPTLQGVGGGERALLVAYERTTSNGGDIAGTCFTHSGIIVAATNLTALAGDANRLPWPQRRPSVDSDGQRFVLGYHEVYGGSGSDLDTRVVVISRGGSNGLFVSEGAASVSNSFDRETDVSVASRYSTGGNVSNVFLAVDDRETQAGSGHQIQSHRFTAAPAGLFVTRSTACGTHTINVSGQALPSGTITFGSSPTPFIPGFVLGGAVSVPVGPCPGCTLGVDGFLVVGASYVVNVPNDPALVGAQFSAQGFVFQLSGAPCIDQIQLSDTIDVTIG